MKDALHSFYAKTAHSRDANEFLVKFHSIESNQFLLVIPAFHTKEELKDFIEGIEYLHQLELSPSFYLSAFFLNELLLVECRKKLEELAMRRNIKIGFIENNDSTENTFLTAVFNKRKFYKIMICSQALKSSSGFKLNRLYLNKPVVEFDENSSKVIEWATPLLNVLGSEQPIQFNSPKHILPELFTLKGAGTMLSLGYEFNNIDAHHINIERVVKLIENGFSRKLRNEYIESLKYQTFCIEEKYRGGIVILKHPDFYYLDKIVVDPSYLGRGIGSLLLDELMDQVNRISHNKPKLIWRSKKDNPFLPKFTSLLQQASSQLVNKCMTVNGEEYVYHIMGLELTQIENAIKFMEQRPSSFEN
jgi:GNAT superfamily N-acetyltransferase